MPRRGVPTGSVVPLACLAVGLVVTLPLLAPGFVLAHDMVFVPRPRWSIELLGVSPALPRSVPTGLWVAAASWAVGGELVQKAVLLGTFAGGAFAAARLVPAQRIAGRVAAGVLYAWNPLTYERIVFGHWALLLGYALLPAAVGAALRLRREGGTRGWSLLLWLAACAAASPYTGAIAAVVAAVVVLWPGEPAPRGRPALVVAAAGVVANLPWLVPSLLHPGVPERPALAVELFGARSDSPLGTLGSLVSLGGLWNTDMAPPGRDTLAWLPVFAAVLVLAALGLSRIRRRWGRGPAVALVVASVAGLVLAAAPAFPGVDGAVGWVAGNVPGGGILRDSQKFVIPWALLLAVAFGLGVERALDAVAGRGRAAAAAFAVVLVALPVGLAPTLAWGAGGRLRVNDYPEAWSKVESITSSDPSPGAILVMPWHAYVPFGWNDGRPVRQPATWWFSRETVTATSLEVGPYELPHEDPWSRLADRVVDVLGQSRGGSPGANHDHARIGVRYVLVSREPGLDTGPGITGGLERLLHEDGVELYRVRVDPTVPTFDRPPLVPVVAGDAVFALALVVAAVRAVRRGGRRDAGVGGEAAAMLARAGPEGGTSR